MSAELGTRSTARPLAGLGLALSFLTILPVRLRGTLPALGAAAPWFAPVGALIGALAAGAAALTEPLFGSVLAALFALAVLVVVTGALHQDGLADCADGLGVRGDRARRLAVMRDSAVGTFGALALAGWALGMVLSLGQLPVSAMLRVLITAAALARAAAVLHAALTRPARTDGLGAAFTVGAPAVALTAVIAAAIATASSGFAHGLVSAVVAGGVAVLTGLWAARSLGGRTGDTLGATVALAEFAVVLTLVAYWRAG